MISLFLVLSGFFSIFCAAKDYDWFINSSKARIFVNMFGRKGARIFYIILGCFVIAGGVSIYFGG